MFNYDYNADMFEYTGRKIKKFAVISFWLGIVLSLVLGIFLGV